MNADQLYQLPLAVVGIALAVVLLPMLSRRVKEGDEEGAARAINRSLEISALLCFPAAAAFIIMGAPICDALFRGLAGDALSIFGVNGSAFTEHDALMTGSALAIFGWGLPAFVWHKIFSPAFFAREDTKTPMNYALIAIALNTVLALVLFPRFGFLAVAFATAVAAWVQVGLLARGLHLRKQFQPGGRLAARLLRIIAASVGLAAFLAYALTHKGTLAGLLLDREWLAVIAISVVGMGVYGVLALLLGAARPSDYKTITGSA